MLLFEYHDTWNTLIEQSIEQAVTALIKYIKAML